ncbi:MAG: hypothetical protein ACYDCD_14800 [Candidatus Acidiferrales bacterium]
MLHLLYAAIAVVVAVQLSSFATSIYLHRTLAHRGVYLNPVVAFPMRLQLWLWTGINTKDMGRGASQASSPHGLWKATHTAP